ncbi:MAG TPA: proton-conducting transporter membrane subunit [Terriglobales bacterium]|nr:proton-conducting transporter membrane subunit [Terriglobales bacterium]
MMSAEQAILTAILLCLGGAVLTLLTSRNKNVAGWLAFAVTTASAVLVIRAVWKVVTTGPSSHAAEFWSMPHVGFALRLYVDGLTAVFLLLAAVIAVPVSLYSIPYMRHYRDYGVARFYPYLLLFLAAMYGLLSTTDMMWFFFIFWQMMTLPGYALIRFEYRKPENVRAANKYMIMMQVACAATMVGAALVGREVGGVGIRYDFDAVSANLPVILSTRPAVAALAFALFLIGFGIKMGMWPFGKIWLPDAHPAAPSPMSAMLSGVMIKTGVYGLLRYFLWLVPVAAQKNFPLAGWGLMVSILGTITLFTGTMQALRQEQSKRLLAFHSIGQVGYILLGTGVCMSLLPVGTPMAASLATLALMGAVLHVLNHGIFKGLLFLNAGSMLHATGTQDLNKLGGLMKYMPVTAVTALVASFSISGVPLFNGYVSKWTIYTAAIQGSGYARYLPLCAVIAILTSTLTLASFIKFFGASFLSRTSALVRSRVDQSKLEVGWIMQLPQLLLATACVLLGVVPALGFRILERALDSSRQGYAISLSANEPIDTGLLTGVAGITSTSLFVPLALLAVLAFTIVLGFTISKLGAARRRSAAPWLCGYAREAEANRYLAHNFYGEIKRYFGSGGVRHT